MRALALGFVLVVVAAEARDGGVAAAVAVPVPDGDGGIGFDDLLFSPTLRQVLAPAGRTGNLDLVDPATHKATAISGFSKGEFGGGHGEGTTSADEGRGLLFASDRSKRSLVVVDPQKRAIVASVKLGSGPDYVRWVAPLGEVWVSEPSAEQIEVFSISAKGTPTPALVATIRVPGGPESLVIDAAHGRAYTHLWKASTVAIDLQTHAVAGQWKNGCNESRGIALDAERALLFAGCDEGMATVMDLKRGGAVVSSAPTGKGVDVIAYSQQLGHLYAPGEDSATMTILAVGKDGQLSPLATVATAKGSHCVVADDIAGVWVCDPKAGQLLYFHDTLPVAR